MACISSEQVQAILASHNPSNTEDRDDSTSLLNLKFCSKTPTFTVYCHDDSNKTSGRIAVFGEDKPLESVAATMKLLPDGIPRPSILDLIRPASSSNLSCLLLSRPGGKKVSNLEFPRIGAHLKVLHEEVLNEWYGLPSNPDEWSNCISWGECFTLLIEQAIDTASSLSLKEPILAEEDVTDLRRLLSRAIAYYVFDDVEVPSLVWCPSLNWKRFVSTGAALESGSKALCLSGWEGAIWGDPLLEGVFANPTQELMESYGSELITLPWHKTKRLWYTVYAALTDLTELNQAGEGFEVTMTEDELRQILAVAIAGLRAT